MMPQTGVVLTLMPLKLLQAKQSEMINHLPHRMTLYSRVPEVTDRKRIYPT